MPRAPLLSEDEIGERLQGLPGWERQGDRLVKTFRFRDFREAVGFLTRLLDPADSQNHHPDVSIHWNELTISLWTHASGGITARDIRLAETIEALSGTREGADQRPRCRRPSRGAARIGR